MDVAVVEMAVAYGDNVGLFADRRAHGYIGRRVIRLVAVVIGIRNNLNTAVQCDDET